MATEVRGAVNDGATTKEYTFLDAGDFKFSFLKLAALWPFVLNLKKIDEKAGHLSLFASSKNLHYVDESATKAPLCTTSSLPVCLFLYKESETNPATSPC